MQAFFEFISTRHRSIKPQQYGKVSSSSVPCNNMFVEKDDRKVEEILSDPKTSKEHLKLAKKKFDFQGTVRVLCKESRLEALATLRVLNLYDNELTSVQGMGLLAQTPVEDINLGNNNLTSIPLEFGALKGLKTLWLDDNKLTDFPVCLCQLDGLETLRLSGNELHAVPPSVANLQRLRVLALDNNALKEFPAGVLQLPLLQHLWLRQNALRDLPEDLDKLTVRVVDFLAWSSHSAAVDALPPRPS